MNFATNKSLLKKNTRRERKKKSSPTKHLVKQALNNNNNNNSNSEDGKLKLTESHNQKTSNTSVNTAVINRKVSNEPRSKRDLLKEEAAEKREIRRMERLRQNSALLIQKTYRGSRIKKNILNTTVETLSKKIHDLNMLCTTLATHGKLFVVPPKIVISLMQQFLYISNIKSSNDDVTNETNSNNSYLKIFNNNINNNNNNNNNKAIQNMLDNICTFLLSSLQCNVKANNLGVFLFDSEKKPDVIILKFSIQRFVKICLYNIITCQDIFESIQLSKSNATSSEISPRIQFIMYILSSNLEKKSNESRYFSNWILNTVFQNGWVKEDANKLKNWFMFHAIRSSIVQIIVDPMWEQQVIGKNHYKSNNNLKTLLSNSIMPVIKIGQLFENIPSGNEKNTNNTENKLEFYSVILGMFFSIPYFFTFCICMKDTKEYFLNIYSDLIQKEKWGKIFAGKDLRNIMDQGEILHCNIYLSITSNICALFDAYKAHCETGIDNASCASTRQILISKLQTDLISMCKFIFTLADYLPTSTYEADTEFIVVKKVKSSSKTSRQSSFRLPTLVVRQLHVMISSNTVNFLMKYLLPTTWEPNPTVTKRIYEYTILEKDLTTEEETARKGVWGRFVKSASWAKKVFVGKKQDVSLDTWDDEGHVNNNNNYNEKESQKGRKKSRYSKGNKRNIQKDDKAALGDTNDSKIYITSEPQHVDAFCSLYMKILWRWWPGMSTQMVSFNLLNTLAYRTKFAPVIWAYLETTDDINKYILSKNDSTNILGTNACQCSGVLAMIGLFTCVYNHIFTVLDDNDLYTLQKPVPIASLIRYILRVKVIIYKMFWETEDVILDYKSWNLKSGKGSPKIMKSSSSHLLSYMPYALRLRLLLTSLMKALYDRNSRQAFCNNKTWLIEDLNKRMGKGDHFVHLLTIGALEAIGKNTSLKGAAWEHTKRLQALTAHYFLQAVPFTVSFVDRLRLFNHIIKEARDSMQGETIQPIRVRIKRSQVFEDGFKHLNRLGPRIRQRLYVNFIDNYGNEESGIDAGGLFKEFWTSLSKIAFNINYGLWALTEDHLMYPSPTASLLHNNSLELYEFLGRVLGKAMFEGIVVNPNFTFFFLRKLLGKTNTLSDLPTLDPELYKNLMFLKNYEGDVDDLALAFTAIDTALGTHKEVPLIKNGENIPVTNENKLRYIYMVAHYRLNVKLRPQCNAFINGMRDVIPVSWLGLFSENELQSVISGINKTINIDELQQYTKYVGGYSSLSPAVRILWDVLRSFNQQDRQKFLHFVTSCERAPPLGFSQLEPKFTIQWVPNPTGEKLPSASTCFNILKLPDYKSKKTLKEKILYSIRSNSGFGLT